MSKDVDRFIPVATMLVALLIGFSIDPSAARPAAFSIPIGLVIGFGIQRIARMYFNAR